MNKSGPVAQRLEQQTHNLLVPGSNPGGPTTTQQSLTTEVTEFHKGNIQSDLPRFSSLAFLCEPPALCDGVCFPQHF
jgi:hypothetical protein